MSRPRHPNKEIEDAVGYEESKGWVWRKQGHWGRLYWVHADRDGCQFGVNGTPGNPENHAKQIIRAVDQCPHEVEETSDEDIRV